MASQRKENARDHRMTPTEIDTARKLRAEGYSTKEIAAKTGRSEQTILIYAPSSAPHWKRISDYKIKQIRRMRRDGKTTKEITQKLGVGRASVLRYGGRTPSHDPIAAVLKARELDAQGIRNRRQQAKIIGIHYNTLYQWLREYGDGKERWNPTINELRAIRQGHIEADRKKDYMMTVARRYGISYTTVQNIVYRKGRYKFL